jgi:hypothetical protein
MIQRKDVPVNDEYSIAIVTEEMADRTWAVVASIKHRSPTGEQVTDLPIQTDRYATQPAAEQAGLIQAQSWISENVPHAV